MLLVCAFWWLDTEAEDTTSSDAQKVKEGIQWMSSQGNAKDPKTETKDKTSLKQLRQLHQEQVQSSLEYDFIPVFCCQII